MSDVLYINKLLKRFNHTFNTYGGEGRCSQSYSLCNLNNLQEGLFICWCVIFKNSVLLKWPIDYAFMCLIVLC